MIAPGPQHYAHRRRLLFAEGDCRKINVLAIQKENELVRSIGFGGHCATGVDFIATVIGYWLEAALDSWSPNWKDPKMWPVQPVGSVLAKKDPEPNTPQVTYVEDIGKESEGWEEDDARAVPIYLQQLKRNLDL